MTRVDALAVLLSRLITCVSTFDKYVELRTASRLCTSAGIAVRLAVSARLLNWTRTLEGELGKVTDVVV